MIKHFYSFKNNPSVMKYIHNSSWLLLEKIYKLLVGFFVSIWIIRYLGPENFGVLSYIQSIVAIAGVFVSLGLESIVLREIIKNTQNRSIIFSTSIILRFFASLVTILFIYFIQYFVNDNKYLLLFLLSLSLVFESASILRVSFQEQVQSKYEVYSNFISLTLGSIIKVVLLLGQYELIYFIWAIVFEKFIYALFLIYFYKRKEKKINLFFDKNQAKYLLQNSWPLILSTLSYIVYTRTDQIMIEHFLGSYEVGIYSAAVRLYEIPFIITTIISGTVTPLLYKKYNENKEEFFALTLKILSFTTLFAYVIVASYYFFGEDIILFLFGKEYLQSYNILIILAFITIIMLNSFLRSGYIVAMNKQKILLYVNIIMIVLNIILNILFFNLFGFIGIAWATLVTRGVSFFYFYLLKDMRKYVYVQLQALLLVGIWKRT